MTGGITHMINAFSEKLFLMSAGQMFSENLCRVHHASGLPNPEFQAFLPNRASYSMLQ